MSDMEINLAIAEACGTEIHADLTNYCSDLNAMNKAEKTLSGWTGDRNQHREYLTHLELIVGRNESASSTWLRHVASPRQRAEAFLRAIGKWA